MLTCPSSVTITLASPVTSSTPSAPVGTPVDVSFGVLMPLGALGKASVRVSTDPHSVKRVRGLGIPSEVLQPIVGRVAVVMASLHPLGAGANEGFKNELMDTSLTTIVSIMEPDSKMAGTGVDARSPESPLPDVSPRAPTIGNFSIYTSDKALVRNFITRHPDHGTPRF